MINFIKSNKNKIFLVFFIILYALFLPIPKYINKTLDGYEITRKQREKDANGDVIGEVELNVIGNAEIKIKGWYNDYLLKRDTNKFEYTIKYGDDQIIRASISGPSDIYDNQYNFMGVRSTFAGYFSKRSEMVELFDVRFTKGYKQILIIPSDSNAVKVQTEPTFIAPKEAFESGVLYDFLNWTYYDGYFRFD